MGQKIHPLGFRLGFFQRFFSHWFADFSDYPIKFLEDHRIRCRVWELFPQFSVSIIEIERISFQDRIKVRIWSPQPDTILTRYNGNLKGLSEYLKEQVLEFRKINLMLKKRKYRNPKISIQIIEEINPDSDAYYIADCIIDELEDRIPFRSAMSKALRQANRAKVLGIKVQIAGRLNGIGIARTESGSIGRIPLHTLRAKIMYCEKTALTVQGTLGVKVWVYLK